VEKSSHSVIFEKKLPKENNNLIGENSLSLVTLVQSYMIVLHSRPRVEEALIFQFWNVFLRLPGANPTIVSYNGRAVKIYNVTSNLVRSEHEIYFLLLWKTHYPTETLLI
jgi:hypothetical protein